MSNSLFTDKRKGGCGRPPRRHSESRIVLQRFHRPYLKKHLGKQCLSTSCRPKCQRKCLRSTRRMLALLAVIIHRQCGRDATRNATRSDSSGASGIKACSKTEASAKGRGPCRARCAAKASWSPSWSSEQAQTPHCGGEDCEEDCVRITPRRPGHPDTRVSETLPSRVAATVGSPSTGVTAAR